jgi:hypothetical protein
LELGIGAVGIAETPERAKCAAGVMQRCPTITGTELLMNPFPAAVVINQVIGLVTKNRLGGPAVPVRNASQATVGGRGKVFKIKAETPLFYRHKNIITKGYMLKARRKLMDILAFLYDFFFKKLRPAMTF